MNSIEDINGVVSELEKNDEFSGVILITQKDKVLFSDSYGYANRPWKIKNSMDMRFDTASMTKLFTAVSILQLVDQGKIGLDTRLVDFLDMEGTHISKDATVYHVLTHTSGIADDAEEEDGELYEDLFIDKPNYSIRNTEDFLPGFIHKEPNFKPGERARYCNCSFILLGLAIEKITGKSYRQYVKEYVFNKSGMKHSDFFQLDGVHENMAEGYQPIKDNDNKIVSWKRNIYSYPPIGSPDSGAYITASDADIFLRSLQSGKLISPELTHEFLKPHVFYKRRGNYNWKYGFVFGFMIDDNNKIICYEKGGINTGVCAMMTYFPDPDINLVVFGNYDDCAWNPLHDIQQMIQSVYVDKNS